MRFFLFVLVFLSCLFFVCFLFVLFMLVGWFYFCFLVGRGLFEALFICYIWFWLFKLERRVALAILELEHFFKTSEYINHTYF